MADMIKCSVCGENNPADYEFCKNCQSRLRPLFSSSKGESASLQPGQFPTKKNTSELEPILPQWLREARQQARQADGDETNFAAQESPSAPASSMPDLLAGLAMQSDDDEDAPDWLVNITGNAPAKKKKVEQEDSNIKRVEMGGPVDFPETPADDKDSISSKPAWMTPQESAPQKDELASWFSEAGQSPASFADERPASVQPTESIPEASSASTDQSDWLHDLQSGASTFDETPVDQKPISSDEPPDWLKNMDSGAASFEQAPTPKESTPQAPVSSDDTPEWIRNMDSGAASFELTPAPKESAPQAPVSNSDTPDWLKSLDTSAALFEQKHAEQPASQNQSAPAPDVPDWLRVFGETSTASTSEMPAPSESNAPTDAAVPSNAMMPDWLKAAAPSGEMSQAVQPLEPAEEAVPPAVDMPNWLSSLKPVDSKSQEAARPALTPQETSEAPSTAPAFANDSLSSGDMEEIFGSMQMPDWLSSAAAPSQPPTSESLLPAAQSGIAPADLPSWVEAMRPVEAALPDTSPAEPVDSGVEMNGPLAGLQGVLPSILGGIKASSRPKSHSIKLNASEEQQAHSALLEKILAEETAPVPMKSPSTILSQRVLRWAITAFLFLFVGGIFFAKTQFFPLPARGQFNDETEATISVTDSIPAGAPVLVVFDYQPSLVGEMEAVGAPLFNRLLLLKHPNLVIVSTSPTGPALAERFMSTTLKERNYQLGVQYVDFGYLAGGLAGVYDFAQNPTMLIPTDGSSAALSQISVLKGATHLSDFAAVIVLTDSAEAGRVWIEQAGPFRGKASFVVVSSAQASPMLMPYFQSGQINGLMAGLNGAAKIEQANGQPGLARRYWDAYSLGLLLAVVCMFLGGFWNFIIGLQARRAEAK